ncbi:MAG: translation initiation factor IF-2 [Methyloligellaceae bacterium]
MSETKETDDKDTQKSRKTMTLSLKRTVESGHVRQNFSHGRSKSVLVEKKKKRSIGSGEGEASSEKTTQPQSKAATSKAATEDKAASKPQGRQQRSAKGGGRGRGSKSSGKGEQRSGNVLKALSSEEKDARARALTMARARAVEEEKQAKVEAARQAVLAAQRAEEEKVRAVEEAAAKEKAEAERKVQEAEAKKKAEAEAAKAPAKKSEAPKRSETRGRKDDSSSKEAAPRRDNREKRPSTGRPAPARNAGADRDAPAKPEISKRAEKPRGAHDQASDDRNKKAKVDRAAVRKAPERVKGKLTITNALNDGQRERSLASLKRKRDRIKKQNMGVQVEREKISREVIIPEVITIQELANRMAERGVDIIKFLMKQGQMHKINDIIDTDTAELIVEEFGHTAKRVSEADVEDGFIGDEDSDDDLQSRAPVVTIMGHVDHGKTSLLDALRQENVVSGEAGGITQHIGAYQVQTDAGDKITFIDTPGHEAFTAMRARGAKVTDMVILVVAADDGVMPQTVEAINHAKAGDVPIIVAINKMDKPSAEPNRVRTDLLQHEIVVESMSGDVLEVEVSAKERLNLDKLLEGIVLQSEVMELKANPDRSAEGVVVEAKLDKGRGPVGTVLIQRGTLRVGDIVVAGRAWGKVRALINDQGEQVQEAGPSVPVEILGFGSAPEAGDQLAVVESEAKAREITGYRVRKRRDTHAVGVGSGLSLEQMMSQLKEQGRQEFPLLIKGDVQGSVEAISAALEKLGTDEVGARIVHAAVGGITESDITLATASNAPILGFNVRANVQAREAAERDGIEVRYYSVIYDLVDDIKAAMSGMLSPEMRETFLGNAEILEVFHISKVGKVAGCRVTEGKVERGAKVRLIRDNVVIHEGELSTLKRFKDEVKEVQTGQECGMAFTNYQDMRPGDVIECFHVEEIIRTL